MRPKVWSPPGGLVTLQTLRGLAAGWNLAGKGPIPWAHGPLETSAHRVGLPDQPAWLTTGTWLDLIDELARMETSPLTVQLVAGDGRFEAPLWSHLRFEAQSRSHGWSLSLRRPGATVAVAHPGTLDTAEIAAWVKRASQALETGKDDFWQGHPVDKVHPAGELPTWEGFARDPDGTWRLGYFRNTPEWDPLDLTDLVDLAWNSGLSRAWVAPGPTLVFRGIPEASVGAWRHWLAQRRRVPQRSPWHRIIRALEPGLADPLKRLIERLDRADQWPTHPIVLATEASDREQGLYCPGHTLVLVEADAWRWRTADGRSAGEGNPAELEAVLFAHAPTSVPAKVPTFGPVNDDLPDWSCVHCTNVYSPRWGDPLMAIPAGLAFEDLPGSWKCPVCSAPASQYAVVGGAHVAHDDSH